jgi:hypothetical protein
MTKPQQILLFADWMPNPSGSGYTVTPRKSVVQEVGTLEAAKLLGVCRATMWELRNDPVAGKILKWRFTTPSQRKVKFTTESLLAYLEYTKTLEGK